MFSAFSEMFEELRRTSYSHRRGMQCNVEFGCSAAVLHEQGAARLEPIAGSVSSSVFASAGFLTNPLSGLECLLLGS